MPGIAEERIRRVLIVEDDRKIGLAIFARLRANGYEAFIALDAETGLKMAIKHLPDLLLLDISLPTRSGLNLAAQLRSLSMLIGMPPMIFMTAHHIAGFRDKATELGAVAYIQKPFKDGELLAVVRQALGGAVPPTGPVTEASKECDSGKADKKLVNASVKLHRRLFNVEKLAESLSPQLITDILGEKRCSEVCDGNRLSAVKLAAMLDQLPMVDKAALEDGILAVYGEN